MLGLNQKFLCRPSRQPKDLRVKFGIKRCHTLAAFRGREAEDYFLSLCELEILRGGGRASNGHRHFSFSFFATPHHTTIAGERRRTYAAGLSAPRPGTMTREGKQLRKAAEASIKLVL